MAPVGPHHEPRKIRRLPKRTVKPPDSAPSDGEFPYHPTLLEIAQRRQEIDVWEALQVGGYRFVKPVTIASFLVSAVMLFLAISPIPPNWPWNIPLVIVAIFGAVTMVVCGLLWFDTPRAGPCPAALAIVPYSRTENLHLMRAQPVEPYCAKCTCPGCGDHAGQVQGRGVRGRRVILRLDGLGGQCRWGGLLFCRSVVGGA
ncbi:hypothetical protein VT930_09660 [Mycobacterium sherrisii]|uniref:hypothetical protein n=1 Tax=Mycobacterium sherrisii TaxID=243061 RepID=UPI002DDCFD7B|nr:hypothetical protein [Mycobacterium sherrisii]MEC4763370.1 hypothetical protein [Mycobacterium sherrisii]